MLKTSSSGSKRSLDVPGEDDDTPTKRTKEIVGALGPEDRPTRPCDLFLYESQSGHSTCTDLSCGETFGRAIHNEEPCAAWPPGPANAVIQEVTALDANLMNSVQDNIRNLFATEEQLKPNPRYLYNHSPELQPDVFLDSSMRMIAVSWLTEVAGEFELHQETLFLAVALLDRFLSRSKAVHRNELQLVSVTAMFVACKHEEEVHPSACDFTNIADNCFQQNDLLRMETLLLQSLEFRINTPTAYTFLSLFKLGLQLPPKVTALASYISELALLEYDLLRFAPSTVATAAVLTAQACLRTPPAAAALQRLCGHALAGLAECCGALLDVHARGYDARGPEDPFSAVRDKYCVDAWHRASLVVPHDDLGDANTLL